MGMAGRFARFALVGGVATGVQYVILIALVRGVGMWAPLASAVGFVVSAGVNYLLNYHFTFRSRRGHGAAVAKFAVLAGVGLGVNFVVMQGLVGVGWYYVAAQVCATVVVLVWNFVGNSVWTFGGEGRAA